MSTEFENQVLQQLTEIRTETADIMAELVEVKNDITTIKTDLIDMKLSVTELATTVKDWRPSIQKISDLSEKIGVVEGRNQVLGWLVPGLTGAVAGFLVSIVAKLL